MKKDHRIPVTPSAYGGSLLIKHLLYTPLQQTPDQEIVFRNKRRYTYVEFYDRVGRLANALTSLGVGPGDTVAVMDWDSNRYLECYFAIPMMGAVLQTVNVRLSPEQVHYTLHHAEATTILVHADFVPLLESIMDRLGRVKRIVLLSEGGTVRNIAGGFVAEYEDMLERANPEFDFPDFDENTRATTFYTTGTTGNPKGVYYSHRQLVIHTLVMTAHCGGGGVGQSFGRSDVYMPLTPLFHVHGWGFPYVATMLGVKQVYMGRLDPNDALDLIEREKVTFSHCVPTILHMVLNVPRSKEVDLSHWKVMIGGAILPKGLAKQALDRGIDVYGAYGMSETCPVLTVTHIKPDMVFNNQDDELKVRGRAGLPAPLLDLRIVDGNMKDVPHDGKNVGEVVARAPWLTMGYLHDAVASEQLWRGGYLHTQDIGYIDPDGYLQVTDRVKDVIKSGGEWISSLELESLVSRHPAVSEVAVIGVRDDKWGERPLVLIVRKPGTNVTAEEIGAHLGRFRDDGTISRYAVPDKIMFVDQIAKTSVGKIDKKVLREKFAVPPPEAMVSHHK